ncbi:MAG: hypothetical protein R6W81_04840 [Bacteroidales bacterium]
MLILIDGRPEPPVIPSAEFFDKTTARHNDMLSGNKFRIILYINFAGMIRSGNSAKKQDYNEKSIDPV